MTRKNSLSTGMDKLKRLVPCLAVIALLTVPCHAEPEWPQADSEPVMTDPSQPDFLAEMQPLPTEPTPVPEAVAEVPAAVETPPEVPVKAEPPVEAPPETPVPKEVQTEVPAEAPAAEETSAPSWPVPEEFQSQPPDNPIVPQKP